MNQRMSVLPVALLIIVCFFLTNCAYFQARPTYTNYDDALKGIPARGRLTEANASAINEINKENEQLKWNLEFEKELSDATAPSASSTLTTSGIPGEIHNKSGWPVTFYIYGPMTDKNRLADIINQKMRFNDFESFRIRNNIDSKVFALNMHDWTPAELSYGTYLVYSKYRQRIEGPRVVNVDREKKFYQNRYLHWWIEYQDYYRNY